MGAAAVPRGGVHPGPALRQLQRQVGVPTASSTAAAGALLPQGALPVVDAPAALEPGVGLQTHAAAVAQRSALVEVSWRSRAELSVSHILMSNTLNTSAFDGNKLAS